MKISNESRKELSRLLESAADLQGQFWDACGAIEDELGVDIDELSTGDLSHWDVDHLILAAQQTQASEYAEQETRGPE